MWLLEVDAESDSKRQAVLGGDKVDKHTERDGGLQELAVRRGPLKRPVARAILFPPLIEYGSLKDNIQMYSFLLLLQLQTDVLTLAGGTAY